MGQYDIALRHVVQRRARDLARGLAVEFPVEVAGWVETQVTAMERRLDKALELRGGGRRRFLQVEFLVDFRGDVPYRMFEYAALLVMALRASGGAVQELPPVDSVAILLSGRREPWPRTGEFRIGWPETEFSGARFRIEAVYQRTVAELLSRDGAFWLVFTPLAVDATPASMRQVLEEIRRREREEEERAELYSAMIVLAELDPWGHNLCEEIKGMLEELDRETIMQSAFLREVFEKGVERGIERGIEKGIEKGIQQVLRELFVRRLHRELTSAEQDALAARARTLGGQRTVEMIADLDGDALLTWLFGPDAE